MRSEVLVVPFIMRSSCGRENRRSAVATRHKRSFLRTSLYKCARFPLKIQSIKKKFWILVLTEITGRFNSFFPLSTSLSLSQAQRSQAQQCWCSTSTSSTSTTPQITLRSPPLSSQKSVTSKLRRETLLNTTTMPL